MAKPTTKPVPMRLTLQPNALQAFSEMMAAQKPPRMGVAVLRPDGKYDVPVSAALYDQLQTHARPKENLSDTLIRVAKGEK